MRTSAWIVRLYIIAGSAFIAHEIDSAYWQEWRLFGIPGGIQLFVVLHAVIAAVLFWGLVRLVAEARSGLIVGFVLGLTCFAALFIHGSFLLRGASEFATPTSFAVLGVMWVTSLPLLYLTGRGLWTS